MIHHSGGWWEAEGRSRVWWGVPGGREKLLAQIRGGEGGEIQKAPRLEGPCLASRRESLLWSGDSLEDRGVVGYGSFQGVFESEFQETLLEAGGVLKGQSPRCLHIEGPPWAASRPGPCRESDLVMQPLPLSFGDTPASLGQTWGHIRRGLVLGLSAASSPPWERPTASEQAFILCAQGKAGGGAKGRKNQR